MAKLTCIMPVYLRPQRTLRAIASVLQQEFDGYQFIIVNDGCPYFSKAIQENWIKEPENNNGENRIEIINLENNHADYGSYARWIGIQKAEGEYTLFIDNDDVILPKHFINYYNNAIINSDASMVYFNTYVEPINYIRESKLQYGSIGHAEIIVKTQVLKDNYVLESTYGHDWTLIQRIMGTGKKCVHVNSTPTYIVKSLPNNIEIGID